MTATFSIGDRPVGSPAPCLIVAEVAQAHDGSLGTAHAYIDVAARAGVAAVKFQTHIAEAESTPGEPFRVHFSRQDATRFDYWRRMEFTPDQWQGLSQHAADVGLLFLSSAFSLEAVELLDKLQVPAWKVGAGEVTNLPLLRRMASTGRPVLLSCGMSPWHELDAAVDCVRGHGAPVAIFQCTSAYPCPPEQLGLNVLAQLRDRYQCAVGLSDHSGQIYAGLAAATLGADLLEVHAVFSRDCFGPDVSASLVPTELAQLVEGVQFIRTAQAHPVDKDAAAGDMSDLRRIFGRGIVAARDLPSGHCLTERDLALKKPANGIPAQQWDQVIGRPLKRAVTRNTFLQEEDLR